MFQNTDMPFNYENSTAEVPASSATAFQISAAANTDIWRKPVNLFSMYLVRLSCINQCHCHNFEVVKQLLLPIGRLCMIKEDWFLFFLNPMVQENG